MLNHKKVTIYDVAQETGLSIATVSRVINNRGGYSDKTKIIVNEAIERLSFVPNSTAKTLASQKSRIIGLVLPFGEIHSTTPENYLIQFLQGVLSIASHHKYNVLLETQPDTFIDNEHFAQPRLYEGIILPHLLQSTLDYVHSLIDLNFPIVYAGDRIPTDSTGHHIYGGYIEYKREMLEYLYQQGHKRIILLGPYHDQNTNIQLSAKVIKSFINEKKLPPDTCQMIMYDLRRPDHLPQLLYDILSSDAPPDAIYTESGTSAAIVYNIAAQLGLSIPDDLSVISAVHIHDTGRSFQPPLSTIYINALEMGKRAAELLICFIEDKGDRPSQEIPFEFINRKSVKNRKSK